MLYVYLSRGVSVALDGANRVAFLTWHEQHADVVRLDVPQEAE